jgi:uncharacterized protein
MMNKQHMNPDTFLLSCTPGEEVVGCIRDFATRASVLGATVSIIGAVSEVELGYYDINEKQYHLTTKTGMFEVVSVMGNVAWKDDAPVVHLHGVFSDTDLTTFGGHIVRMVVSAACEIVMTKSQTQMVRKLDPTIGLATWCLGE